MLRFFQLISDPIVYDGSYNADVTFAAESAAPAAIIGLETAGATRALALQNECSEFKVAARQYNSGDPFPLGLLMPIAPGASGAAHGRPYFPGAAIPLPGGGTAGAILMNRHEHVRLRIKDLSAGSAALTQVVLHCVEFTENCRNAHAVKEMRERLRAGRGEIYFAGNKQTYTAAGVHTLSAQPRMPNRTPVVRRIAVRGETLVTADASVAENDFALIKAGLYTSTNRAPHNAAVPARAVIGHGALDIPGAGMVDMKAEGRALIDLVVPTPSASRIAALLQIFEGREESAELLDTSRAVS